MEEDVGEQRNKSSNFVIWLIFFVANRFASDEKRWLSAEGFICFHRRRSKSGSSLRSWPQASASSVSPRNASGKRRTSAVCCCWPRPPGTEEWSSRWLTTQKRQVCVLWGPLRCFYTSCAWLSFHGTFPTSFPVPWYVAILAWSNK